jgi:hypothetical protein
MPADAWRRARAFAWMTALLHFDKLLQIPLVVLHALGGIGYRRSSLQGVESARFPCSARYGLLRGLPRAIQGGPEYVYSREWLWYLLAGRRARPRRGRPSARSIDSTARPARY